MTSTTYLGEKVVREKEYLSAMAGGVSTDVRAGRARRCGAAMRLLELKLLCPARGMP
jgi:hypothetical protein